MSKPCAVAHVEDGASREVDKERALASAQALPLIEEMLIHDLTEDEAQPFFDAVFTA